jgi:cyclase
MTREIILLLAVASVSTGARAQEPGYPITVVPPGKGPYHFPEGYQTPWDKIEMLVTEKLAPNLYSLHGSAGLDPSHPDAAGGRVVVLFGSDGVLMVDTEDPQLATKTLDTIRTFTSAPIKIVVNSHIHPDHTGGNGFFAKQGAVIFSQENLRDEMLSPPGQGNGNRALDPAGIPTSTYRYVSPGAPAVTIHMNGETVDFIPMMPSHTAGDTIVRFNQANVIYIEDFYRNFGYPFCRSGQRRFDQGNDPGRRPH